ncbi:conserved Plasmodium membrane protein, unknown function [Plasmodium knowlesi strain H]|uniref:Transporter n=3 Tax=Plasmodium knowlesi TaxID=5850 RepID=A0A5K1UDH7_PLAKH|nr:conserved Plasmodium membrane protein, unknown function [Plasmodium knowlesi strain H]OTN65158.1 Uncharacterized protein PKNOH_S120133500 [Plasmodium knowlesi]CAA9988194.1 conserved Plasmodium membrane protein, unknown function [Plasmodium knowlesi strain H]SBO20112.1 conserved Plasmodium membrane protein, unknown function [Plasmodium knowlesi strain H]SBO20655.1 conserved Plasmodium membrane protein, unknown function [Plasmodium knowlesi strain H]VVS77668.1 conserved Plasmodium membrane pr|eukprot:XP_002259171.1 hypothetical protein, conserved in Plasmodium species [Plasmodium knowlesi strain H]
MSEYQISSVYFSRKNKLLLLICVFFFSCSTHIFKNVFPFLFMLTGVRNEIDLDNVVHQEGGLPARKDEVGSTTKGEGKNSDMSGEFDSFEEFDVISLSNDSPGGSPLPPPVTVSHESMHSSTYFQTKDGNSQSIYLYSNILSLIYCSSLVTYIFILIFDLGKKNYVVNTFYIVNLVSHFIIFILLSDIQMRNTDLRVVTRDVDTSMSTRGMPPVGKLWSGGYPGTERIISPNDILAKRRDINFYFKRNVQDRLKAWEFLSVGFFQRSVVEFILTDVRTASSEVNSGKEDKNNNDKDVAYTYERKYLKFLYLFIIISSICSGYIKIYQKRIMYCIFYVNIGVITSLLILMNSLFKLFAHSLNYVVTSNNSKTDISDYIILFLVIDMFGLLMMLIFTYRWFYQKNLWVNMHTIFYNYKYVCFYHKETYYLYSLDKQIDNILVHIDMCGDENIKITFCAYMNLKKSIFYDYLCLNKFRKNKLRILEIADDNLQVKSTYKMVDPPMETDTPNRQLHHPSQVEQHGTPPLTPTTPFTRKKNHSYTMKPYKICIEPLNSLANLQPNGEEGTLADGYLASSHLTDSRYTNEKNKDHLQMNADVVDEGDVKTGTNGEITKCVKKQKRRLSKGDSVHFLDQQEGQEPYARVEKYTDIPHEYTTQERSYEGIKVNGENGANDVESKKLYMEEDVETEEREEQKRNILFIPNYDDECNRNVDYSDEWELFDDKDDMNTRDSAGGSFLSRAEEKDSHVKKKLLNIYQGIKKFSSSFTFYFFFFIFIYAFLLSIMHIFINYFFYIYLFVFNINIYVSNVYTIIMTFVSLIAIPFSGYIVDNIGSFLSLLLCSSSFILVAISGSIYCYKFNLNSEALAFLFFNLIGISESIIPTVIISQIPTHLCVKNNEDITSAFAFFELVTMIIISLNNYVFGCFLIKEEYLKGLYVLFFFVILVISLILLLIVTIYIKKKRSVRAYKSPRNADLAQPLL